MTPEQKIIAIAEFEGWQHLKSGEYSYYDCWFRVEPEKGEQVVRELPPYLTSRDAICGAVARLDENTFDYFVIHLQKVTGGVPLEPNALRKILLATPAQLADALLLTIGYEI